MCKVVIRDVLLPLVVKYGQSIDLWPRISPSSRLEIGDEQFVDFLEAEFHDDFKMAGKHSDHKREAILSLRRGNPAELDKWIDRKLRKYLRLRTVIREHLDAKQYLVKLRAPRDRYLDQYEQADEVIA